MSIEKSKSAQRGDKVARIRIGSPVVQDYDLVKKEVVLDDEEGIEQRNYSVVDQAIGKTTLEFGVEIDQETGEAIVAIDADTPKDITGELLRASTAEVIENSRIHPDDIEFDQPEKDGLTFKRIVEAGLADYPSEAA